MVVLFCVVYPSEVFLVILLSFATLLVGIHVALEVDFLFVREKHRHFAGAST